MGPVDDAFRVMMAAFPTGVSVITARLGTDPPRGTTCSALCSVSADPPMLLVCLNRGSATLRALTGSGTFAVNLLHDQARAVAQVFASGARDRFDQVPWRPVGPHGSPALIEAAHTVAECLLERADPAGDHVIVVARVRRVHRLCDERPLLYGFRDYGSWSRPAPVAQP